jgi:two-component system cell cycle sensor histidine kinase/response regulator CckA
MMKEAAQRAVRFSPTVLYSLRTGGDELRVTWIGGNFARLLGFRPDELPDRAAWLARLHPDDRARVERSLAPPYTTEHAVMEYRFRHRDGSYRWLRDERQLVQGIDGQPDDVVGTWSDVTDRVLLEEQLRQSQKLEAIGVLAGGVAHDFNNLLTVIGCSTELLRSMVEADDPRSDLLCEIACAAERGASLTRQLLLFSRAQIATPALFDVNQVLRGIEKMLRRLIGEDVKLCTSLPGVCAVRMDPGQLEQVILNFAVNARDAMARGGTLSIVTRVLEIDDARAHPHIGVTPGRFVSIEVRDTGCGMTPEVLQRVFEPFFTTKGIGKGTGLGLATVFGIVRSAGGFVEVESEPGAGSTFRVHLPLAGGALAEPATAQRVKAGGEVILLVEDDPSVRRATRGALVRLGYRVIEASSTATALALANAHPEIDLLLTDVVLPESSGCELAATLLARRPGLGVLFMSGYIDDAVMRHGIAISDSFLQKPFTSDALAQKIRDILDRDDPDSSG